MLCDQQTGEVYEDGALIVPENYTRTALLLPDGMHFERWSALGQTIQKAASASMWWIGDWWAYGEHRYGERAAQALDGNYAMQTFMNAGYVAKRIETYRRREVLSFSHHAEVAALPPEQADALLDEAEREGWNREELRRAVRRSRLLRTTAPETPPGKYRVIYADPPWRYNDKLVDGYGAAKNHYHTLSIEELCAWPVRDKVEDDAVLFLWVTSPMLFQAFPVNRRVGLQVQKYVRLGQGQAQLGALQQRAP